MPRKFVNSQTSIQDPALNGFAVTPSDSTDLASTARGFYVGVGGNVALITANDNTLTFVNMIGGVVYPISACRILATGTTASSIIALY